MSTELFRDAKLIPALDLPVAHYLGHVDDIPVPFDIFELIKRYPAASVDVNIRVPKGRQTVSLQKFADGVVGIQCNSPIPSSETRFRLQMHGDNITPFVDTLMLPYNNPYPIRLTVYTSLEMEKAPETDLEFTVTYVFYRDVEKIFDPTTRYIWAHKYVCFN